MALPPEQEQTVDRVERLAREKRLVGLHRLLAAEMTLAQSVGDERLGELLEGVLWPLTAAIEWSIRQ